MFAVIYWVKSAPKHSECSSLSLSLSIHPQTLRIQFIVPIITDLTLTFTRISGSWLQSGVTWHVIVVDYHVGHIVGRCCVFRFVGHVVWEGRVFGLVFRRLLGRDFLDFRSWWSVIWDWVSCRAWLCCCPWGILLCHIQLYTDVLKIYTDNLNQ